MTSLKSSTLIFAAFAPAPVSSEAVVAPAHDARQDAHLEERDELLLRVNLACVPRTLDFTRHVEQRTLSQSSDNKPEKKTRPRRFRGRL